MNPTHLRAKLLLALNDLLPPGQVRSLDPDRELGLDSIEALGLMLRLERILRIPLLDGAFPRLSTLNDYQHYLGEQISQRRGMLCG